jgi:hypothetical protein
MSFIRSLRNILAVKEVSVMVGTMALIRIVDANSALTFWPSTPAFAVAILA